MNKHAFDITNKDFLKNWGKQIINGALCLQVIEDDLNTILFEENWFEKEDSPCLFDIFCDTYDESLEFCFCKFKDIKEIKKFCEEKLNHSFANFVYENGIVHFWVNFYEKETKNLREGKVAELYCNKNYTYMNFKIFNKNGKAESVQINHVDNQQ